MSALNSRNRDSLKLSELAVLVTAGAASFHLAFNVPTLAAFVLIYFGCLVEITRAASARQSFYSGLILGFLIFVPKIFFLWSLFGGLAIILWIVLASWHGLFLLLGHAARTQLRSLHAILLFPFLWTGLEYFRSELYFLRFSWLAPGYVFRNGSQLVLQLLGVYGISFVLLLIACLIASLEFRPRIIASCIALLGLYGVCHLAVPEGLPPFSTVEVAGMQLEFPIDLEVPLKLDQIKLRYPDAPLYVLSEYTFDGPVPKRVLNWCKTNQKYLVAGGKTPAGRTNFYNTAFVIGPSGEIVFSQAKAVPIQFFADGLPAAEQRVWESPWGKIGLCVCYDLSYTRVVDHLIRLGAQALVVPTMDVSEWGESQHKLHTRIAPMRAIEYGIPVFRLASSGISQVVNAKGEVEAFAPFPGQEAILHGFLNLRGPGHLPMDRVLAPICVLISAISACAFSVIAFQNKPLRRIAPSSTIGQG